MKILFIECDFRDANNRPIFGGGTQYERDFIEIIETMPEHTVTRLKIPYIPFNRDKKIGMYIDLFKRMRYFKRTVKQAIKQNGIFDAIIIPDLFIKQAIPAQNMLWKRRKKTKIILITHHEGWEQSKGIPRMLQKKLQLNFYKKSHAVVFSCRPAYEKSGYLKETKRRSKTLVEIPQPRAQIPNVKKIPNRICYVGRIQRSKGIIELCRAMNIVKTQIPEFDVQLVGNAECDIEYTAEIKKYIAENFNENQKITFCGGLPNEEKNKILASSQFFVFPSHIEGYGLVMHEAMQFGLPVIAWNVSAMPFTVKHEQNGLLVPHNNIPELAAAIVRLYTDKNLLARLSTGALESFKNTPTPEAFRQNVLEFGKTMGLL